MSQVTIKVLGTGCASCVRLEKNAREALAMGSLDAEVVKVTDVAAIMAYGIIRTPGLVLNDKVLVSGRVPNPDEVLRLVREAMEAQA